MSVVSLDMATARRNVTDIGAASRAGGLVVALFMGLFGLWALFAPITGAVVAPGYLVSDARTQMLQHALGGTVAEVLVREGDEVAAGQVVAVLRSDDAQARLTQLSTRMAQLDAELARLNAERDGVAFAPGDVAAQDGVHDPALFARLLNDQKQSYVSRAQRFEAERQALMTQREALGGQVAGFERELKSYQAQAASLDADLQLRRTALSDGYGKAAALRALEREAAQVDAQIARAQSQLISAGEQLAEVSHRLTSQEAARANDISERLAELGAERLGLHDEWRAALNAVSDVEIRTDQAGVVKKLHVTSSGSTIAAHTPIAEIVPTRQPILIEARVAPADIDSIGLDQQVDVAFSGTERAGDRPLSGSVVFVAPDSEADERSGARYFTVRVEVDKLPDDLPTVAGMAVEAYFVRSSYTLAQYLIAPITDNFGRAFR